ncbi:MAG: cytochrome [Burkholderiales bacterium]|nr:cytochrome [Burkholderiales bacterium]
MNTRNEYTATAKILHWLMAILIILQLLTAYLFLAFDNETLKPYAGILYFLHFNIGFSILLLFILRVCWRLTHKIPPYPPSLHPKEITIANLGHIVIYVLIGTLVLTGILRYNIHSGAFHYFNFITIPAIITTHNQILYSIIAVTHNLSGDLLLAIIAIHIAMAIRHQIIDKNNILQRMVPRALHKFLRN